MGKLEQKADLIGLRLHLQDPLHSGVTVRPGVVDVCEPLPRDPVHATLAMEQDAEQLADVLWETLPGATIDLLIATLMGRRASTLRVGLLSVQEIVTLQRAREQASGSPGGATGAAARGADAPGGAGGVETTGEAVGSGE